MDINQLVSENPICNAIRYQQINQLGELLDDIMSIGDFTEKSDIVYQMIAVVEEYSRNDLRMSEMITIRQKLFQMSDKLGEVVLRMQM